MTRLFVFFIFLFFSSFSYSLISTKHFIAQDDSFFDDSDLADIESADSDDALEQEFDTFSEDDDNFDKEEFEELEEEQEDEEDQEGEGIGDSEDKEEEFDKGNYEVISDKPGYEVVTDEEIEREFEEGSSGEEEPVIEDLEEGPVTEDLEEEPVTEDLEEEPVTEDLEEEPVTEDLEEEPVIEDLEEEPVTEDLEEEPVIEDLEEEPVTEDLEEEPVTEDLEEEPVTEDLEEEPVTEDLEEEPVIEDLEEEPVTEEPEEEPVIEEPDRESDESLNLITNIRYLSAEDQIVIDCSEATSYQVKKNIETNQYIIEIFQAKLGDNLHWPYVLRDFDTQFGMIKSDQKDSNTVRVIIQLKEGADFPQSTLSENSDQILIGYGTIADNSIVSDSFSDDNTSDSILPAKTLEDLYFGDTQFSGDPISLHVIDAPVKQVLRFISEESGLNMVVGERVSGTVTLKLEDVPWDQALYTIFKVKSLGYTRDGNVITILPLDEIEKRTKKLKEISDRRKSLAPYVTKVIPISYGKMSEIAEKVKDFSTKGTDYVKPGQIIIHPESNTFVIIDTEEVIKKMEAIIGYLDKPPKQVMVEAKIVEAAENFTKTFGLNWGITGNLPVRLNVGGFLDFFKGITGSYRTGAPGGATRLNLNNLPIVGNLQASLDLAESNDHAQVISTPKVVVISGKTANINRNSPILIDKSTTTTTTAEGGTSQNVARETMDVNISLDVTPTVTTVGSVFLQVNVTRTDPGPGVTSGEAGGALAISKTAKTEVLVKNGETIVIGGLYEKNEAHGARGIPILKNIPFLNMLFSNKGRVTAKSELLVFITPRLLDEP